MQPHPYLPHHHPRRVRIQCASSVLLIGTVLLLCQPALATDLHSHAHHASPSHAGEATSPHRGHAHDHDDADDAAGHSPHDSSRTADVRRDEIPVAVPDRSLVDRHGRSVHLNTLLDTDGPITPELLARLRAIPGVLAARTVGGAAMARHGA